MAGVHISCTLQLVDAPPRSLFSAKLTDVPDSLDKNNVKLNVSDQRLVDMESRMGPRPASLRAYKHLHDSGQQGAARGSADCFIDWRSRPISQQLPR